jgi:hypothetical protein
LALPLIFCIEGKENLLRWNTKKFGSLLSSVFILAFVEWLHFSHLYLSWEERTSSFKKFDMHLSREVSKARLRDMKGLKVTEGLLHLPQVTMVFYIPIYEFHKKLLIITCKSSIYYRRMPQLKSLPYRWVIFFFISDLCRSWWSFFIL